MRQKPYTKKDGSAGMSFFPEHGDEFVSRASKISEFQHPAIVNGKAVIIKSYSLAVTDKDGNELFLTLSEGQSKSLTKWIGSGEFAKDLMGKTIVFANYIHPKYGAKLGARVKGAGTAGVSGKKVPVTPEGQDY